LKTLSIQALEPPVKLKLILSFFQIPRRSHEMWRAELDKIISVAQMDSEPWVAMIGEILKTYPATGNFK
jgi:negative elongation factor A